jgi:hypothetical protein
VGEITVRAESTVLGMRPGERTVTEDSPYIRAVIAGGRLSVVDCEPDDAASLDGPPPSATGPYAVRERLEDAPEPELRLKGTPEFDDAA